MHFEIDRRGFMGTALAAVAVADSAWGANEENLPHPTESRRGDMLYRSFGKTGETVSVLAWAARTSGKPRRVLATRIVRTAIDRGINFMDNAWDYNNGNGQGEIKMGKALRDGYRQKVFPDDQGGRPHQTDGRPATGRIAEAPGD